MSSLSEQIKTFLPCPLYMVATVNEAKEWKRYLVKYSDLDKFFPKNPTMIKNEYHFKPMLSKKEDGYYVFLDDMTEANIMKMKLDGIVPALEVETSPSNFQVWIRFKNKMNRETIKATCEYLTNLYDADRGAIASSHFGRVPTLYRTTKAGKRFLVRITNSSSIVNENISDTLLPKQEHIQYIQPDPRTFQRPSASANTNAEKYVNQLLSKGYENLNSVDFIASIWLLRDGFYKDEILRAMLQASPNIRKRKHNEYNAIRYLNYTIDKASTRVGERPGISMR